MWSGYRTAGSGIGGRFVGGWAEVAEAGMPSAGVVPAFDVFEDCLVRQGLRGPRLPVEQFGLDGPQPGNRNDCTVCRDSGIADTLAGRPVMADGGYRGNPSVIMPYRKRAKDTPLPDWQENLDKTHRKVRVRVEHALARMKTYKILRDYRRAGHPLAATASGIAFLYNLAITG
jgi:hypothetical protein